MKPFNPVSNNNAPHRKEVTLPVSVLHTMLVSLHAFNNGTMTPRLGSGLSAAVSFAYMSLSEAVMPPGIRLGMELTARDHTRAPIFSQAFNSPVWEQDRITVAYELMAAAGKAADHFNCPEGFNPFHAATRDHYFSDVLSLMNLAGFDTVADADGFAVYAPEGKRRAVLTPQFRKAVTHGPRP